MPKLYKKLIDIHILYIGKKQIPPVSAHSPAHM